MFIVFILNPTSLLSRPLLLPGCLTFSLCFIFSLPTTLDFNMIRVALYLALLTSLARMALGFPDAESGLAPRSDGAAEGSRYLEARATLPRAKVPRAGLKPQRQEAARRPGMPTSRRYKKRPGPGSLRQSGRMIKTKDRKGPSGMEMAKAGPRKRSSVNKELELVLEGLGL
jgi:hypothetical protein